MSPAASTRWCPTPEQVMILEELYRGGLRTPNASQIQHITSHLSLYGKIEGKNVFYWFQNHKARERQKLRKKLVAKQHLQFTFSHDSLPNCNHHHVFDQHFQYLPNYHHFDPTFLPPPPLPPPSSCSRPTTASLGVFHQLPPLTSSPCFAAHHVSYIIYIFFIRRY